MVNVKLEQAKAIVDLTLKIQKLTISLDHVIVGIPTDGVPIVKGIAYVLKHNGIINGEEKAYSYLAASSKYDFIDKYRLGELKELNRLLIFIDWHTVSGKLGCMLKENYSNSIYAVLSDPNNKADICATTKDIPKFTFPRDYKETLRTIGMWIEPNTVEDILKLQSSGGEMKYFQRLTEQSKTFYKTLFKKIDEVLLEK